MMINDIFQSSEYPRPSVIRLNPNDTLPTMLARKSSLDNLTAADFAVRKKSETLVGARRRKSSMPTRIRQNSFHSWYGATSAHKTCCEEWYRRVHPWILLLKVWQKPGPKCPLCPNFDCLVFVLFIYETLQIYKNIESGTISVLVYVQAVVNQLGSSYMRAVEIL